MRGRRLFLLPMLIALGLALACSEDTQRPKTEAGPADQGPPTEGGGGDGQQVQKVEAYMPADNEVSGWAEDASKGQPGVEAGYTTQEIEAIIDGKHDPYAVEGCKGFALEYYTKDLGSGCTGKVQLYLWEMNAAAGALNMYNYNKNKDETDSGITFETAQNVQTAGIVGDDAPGFRAYAHKNAYMLYIWAEYTDPSCKDTLKAETITWLEHVTQKLP